MIGVAWQEWAFTGPRHHEMFDGGRSIAELLAALPSLPALFDSTGEVRINGRRIPRHMWRTFWPKGGTPEHPVVITLHAPLQGGGGRGSDAARKNPFATIASIALLAITIGITAGLAAPLLGASFAAGTLGAQLLSAGVGIAGSLAIQALFPPPQPPKDRRRDGGELATASAEGNLIERGGPIPRVVGTHRIFPPLATQPFSWMEGDEEVVEAVYALAGPHALTDIRVADALLSEKPKIEYETREGWDNDLPISLVIRQAFTKFPSETLIEHGINKDNQDRLEDQSTPENSLPKWHNFTAQRGNPDEIHFRLTWPSGLYDGDNTIRKMGVATRIQIRLQGAATWINLPEIHWWGRNTDVMRKEVRIKWTTAPTQTTPRTDEGPAIAYISVPTQNVAPTGMGGWTAHSWFDNAGAGTTYYSSGFVGSAATRVQNIDLFPEHAAIYLDADTFPKGKYELRIMRSSVYNVNDFSIISYGYSGNIYDFFGYSGTGTYVVPKNQKNVSGVLIFERLSSVWNEHPIQTTGLALIAIRSRTPLAQLSVLASGYVPDYAGGQWETWSTTSNPAPHLRYVWAGPLNADPVDPALIDDAGLLEWRTRCTDEGFTVNAILEGTSVADTAQVICAAGYARVRQSDTWGVIMDRDRSDETPIQIFTPRNMANFRWSKALPKRPDGFRARFRNASDDYVEDELIVLDEGVTEADATRLEDIDYTGFTSEAGVEARAAFDLEQSRLRGTIYSADTDAQMLVCQRGDLVGVEHDTLSHHTGRARVAEVIRQGMLIKGLVLDSEVPVARQGNLFADADLFDTPDVFALGAKTGAAIRLRDGSLLIKRLDIDGGTNEDTTTIFFDDPFPDPDMSLGLGFAAGHFHAHSGALDHRLDIDCLVTVGRVDSEFKRLLVADMAPGPNLTASLTFVDEAPELWQ